MAGFNGINAERRTQRLALEAEMMRAYSQDVAAPGWLLPPASGHEQGMHYFQSPYDETFHFKCSSTNWSAVKRARQRAQKEKEKSDAELEDVGAQRVCMELPAVQAKLAAAQHQAKLAEVRHRAELATVQAELTAVELDAAQHQGLAAAQHQEITAALHRELAAALRQLSVIQDEQEERERELSAERVATPSTGAKSSGDGAVLRVPLEDMSNRSPPPPPPSRPVCSSEQDRRASDLSEVDDEYRVSPSSVARLCRETLADDAAAHAAGPHPLTRTCTPCSTITLLHYFTFHRCFRRKPCLRSSWSSTAWQYVAPCSPHVATSRALPDALSLIRRPARVNRSR